MGKRSDFKRVARDAYDTPLEAVLPLLPHLARETHYIEPCAGNKRLIQALSRSGHVCEDAYDIEPSMAYVLDEKPMVHRHDAKTWVPNADRLGKADCFITNPPWSRDILHPLIIHLSDMLPTWLLFDADWVHTRQARPFQGFLRKVVSVGRVKWIPGTTMTGKDNCAWHLFDRQPGGPTLFYMQLDL